MTLLGRLNHLIRQPFFWSLWATSAGAIASVLSVTDFCPSSCRRAHEFTLQGAHLGVVGVLAFFAFTGLVLGRTRLAAMLRIGFLAAVLGAEVWLVYIQTAIIGQFCPLCLVVLGLWLVLAGLEIMRTKNESGGIGMKKMKLAIVTLCMALAGFTAAMFGVVDDSEAAAQRAMPNIWLGNATGNIEVLFVSDWFCPSCRNVEKEWEATSRLLATRGVKHTFLDLPVHEATLDFIPVHVALLAGNKQGYLEARAKLGAFAASRKGRPFRPTQTEIEQAVAPMQVKNLVFAEVAAVALWSQEQIRRHGVRMTPTVIVRNIRDPKKAKVLEGAERVRDQHILAAIQEVSR